MLLSFVVMKMLWLSSLWFGFVRKPLVCCKDSENRRQCKIKRREAVFLFCIVEVHPILSKGSEKMYFGEKFSAYVVSNRFAARVEGIVFALKQWHYRNLTEPSQSADSPLNSSSCHPT